MSYKESMGCTAYRKHGIELAVGPNDKLQACQHHRGHKGPGQVAVQRKHGVIGAAVVAADVGVHDIQLSAQIVPEPANAVIPVEPACSAALLIVGERRQAKERQARDHKGV